MATEKERKPGFTPENIADSERLFDVKLSPDAKQLLYHVKPQYKSSEHVTCAIWLGDVGRADSARQFTSGLFNDFSARFHPGGQSIIFLSDRHKAGGPAQIYSIDLQGGEAYPLFCKENKKAVSEFEISPDGRYIAFSSPDEPTPEDERREKEKDDPKVFWDKRDFNRLRLYSFATREIRAFDAARGSHVFRFTWASDSKSLIFLARRHSALEFGEEEIFLQRISISVGARAQVIGSYPRSPSGPICLLSSGEIVDIQSYEPSRLSDAKSIFVHSPEDFSRVTQLYGEKEDAVHVVDLRKDNLYAVEVADGMKTHIQMPNAGKKYDSTSLFITHDEDIISGSWDVGRMEDGTFVLAAIRSSGPNRKPPNVWTGTSEGDELSCDLSTKISSHFQWMLEGPEVRSELFGWIHPRDDIALDGITVFPPRTTISKPPYPTVMLVHGGPYSRVTLGFVPSYTNWHFLLASQGYLVISPNYRGGQGHGSKFARAAQSGMGTVDWSDCESMLDMLIDHGLADPNRSGIGGWSQGGFMTAWGVATTKNRFKAGVMGAGVSDWGTLTETSDLPEFEADLGGCAPWDTADPTQRVDLHGSPIGHVSGVETAVLILHGEKDERVPASQGIAFFRGLRRRAKYPERAQLVIYPREPHGFTERNHVKDVMERVVEHFNSWL